MAPITENNFCKRYAKHGNRTTDLDICESYDADSAVVAWRADNNPLTNFCICTMAYGDCVFTSSEQFYQYEFCMFMERNGIAQKVHDAASHQRGKTGSRPAQFIRALYKPGEMGHN